MVVDNKKLGNIGEEIVARYLKNKGYKILERNYRAIGTDIDIIAMDKNILVFIEVKTRSTKKFGYAFEAVDEKKIKNIIQTSLSYIMLKGLEDFQVRYDVIEFYIKDDVINHIENAFEFV
ncbi:MAG: YraN family protein [Peptoniphilaceae bacterium]